MTGFTLDELREFLEAERRSRTLVNLPENFYRDAAKYLSRLAAEAEASEGMRRELLKSELRGVIRALQELHLTRRIKAMWLMSVGMPHGVSGEEREGFDEIGKIVERMEEGLVLSALMAGSGPTQPSRAKRSMCIMLIDLPERIIGEDRKPYGPFRKGDVVNLPERNAELLIKNGAARALELAA